MLDVPPVRSLHLHSLDSLLADLINGRPVGLDEEGTRLFMLESVEARALLDWYRANERAWSKNIGRELLPVLVTAAAQTPSNLMVSAGSAPAVRVYEPKRVEIFRFGGVQEYNCSEPLVIDFDKPALLLEGNNGSGKTSILNAVVWCLTGKVYRAQRAPADGHEPVPLAVRDTYDEDADDTSIASTLVCPVPPKTVLDSLGTKPLPLDTWVAVTFIESKSRRELTVRRRLCRKRSGKPEIETTGFDELQLDPVAYQVGTTMPGLLPHIRIGAESDLGKAIAELTGLAPLRLMVKHARRAKERIEKELIGQELDRAIEGSDTRFLNARAELAALATEHPQIAPADAASVLPTDRNAEARLTAVAAGIRQWQASAYADARTVLGDAFDPQDAAARQRLDGAVGGAVAALKPAAIGMLDSAATLNGLGKLTDQELSRCEAALRAFRMEAQDLRMLATDPVRESRLRLYARVANWLRDAGHEALPDTCPVCLQPFGDQADPATGRLPHEHLVEALGDGKAFLEKTLAVWSRGVLGALAHDLPEALSRAMRADLPATPADLLRAALTGELFGTEVFGGALAALRPHVVALCNANLAALPPFREPPADMTLANESAFADLHTALHRLDRALAFARWRRATQADCTAAFLAIVGREQVTRAAGPLHEQPLCRQVEALADIVRAAAPSNAALRHVGIMQRELSLRRAKEADVARARKAAAHLEELFPIGELVHKQLDVLRHRLDGDTRLWMDRLYRAATAGTAPNPCRSAVDSAGKLDVVVERAGTLVSAEHIGNASFLRAYLMAFMVAFWKHVRDVRGGLSLLVLDDPQEMLDPNNRRRLSEALGHLLAADASLLVSTHDSRFALEICAEMRPRQAMRHLSVHGRNASRACTLLAPSVETLDEKRRVFRDQMDNHQAARDYANAFRIFVEARISDFADQPAFAQPQKPELASLLSDLRRQVGFADGLSGPMFEALRDEPSLQPGADFLQLMNRVHHRDADDVTWNDVKQFEETFHKVRRLVLDVHEEHRRWLKRDPVARGAAPVLALDPMRAPAFGALRRELNLASFSVESGGGGGEGSGGELSDAWFADKALFVLCADTLGFAAPIGSVLIVECTNTDVEDHRMVVAQHAGRVYARRLVRGADLAGRVVLVAETENPLHRPPPVVLPAEEVRLYKVMGVLFTSKPVFSRDGNEAFRQAFHPRLKEIRRVYQARGTSGVPLVLDGQMVLGGMSVAVGNIDQHRQRLVAVRTDDGKAFFKRVGEPLTGLMHLRLFESVGGLGDSRVIQMEPAENGDTRLPRFVSAREVIGVLYG